MAKKRLLYIEDLYDFYSNKYKRSTKFSAEKTGEPLVVQVHGRINFDESDKNKDGLLPVHLQSCHTDLNVNGSNIESSVMEAALPSFSNRPILGYIHKVTTDENPEGQWEFYSHNMHEDENGDVVYDEYPIGIIPESCNAQLVYDEEKKKTYCEVDGYIFEEYSKAAEILQREEECSVSVELSIRELSYDAKQKFLNIEDFWFSGVTILGKTPQGNEVKPGMTGSNIKLADFSSKNNSLFEDYESKMVELQARIENLETACFNKEQNSSVRTLSKEGGNKESMTKFEELLAKYNKTVENVTFDYSELSDEELEAKFAEVFGEDNNTDGDNSGDNTANEPSNDNEGDGENTTEPEGTTDGDNEGEGQNFENMTKTFEISHDDIRYALYNLLSSYEDADNEWYYITGVYDSYFVYESWDGGKIYGQKYTKDNDNVSFDGERYNLHKEYLTDSEYTEIQDMRSNYSSVVEELNTYKSAEVFADKMTVFDDEAYSEYLDTDEFKALMSEDSVNKYSKEELSEKADATLGKLVKKNKTFSFAGEIPQKKHVNRVAFNAEKETEDTYKPYGDLFD
jgi:hypothetical protein|uniref:Uncharacterized protein n=1 Tax=Siphoviridae sp. cttFh17 TaxID=2826491 RepID=A0A8S5NIJ6_9CAUD|nr:MAG TPA: hypothetical protein [Siphoviridae sp. cttFh17]